MKTSIILSLFFLSSCCISTGPTIPPGPSDTNFFNPSYPTDMPPGYSQSSCVLYSYQDQSIVQSIELDLASDVATKEDVRLQQTQEYYMDKFNLSLDSASKMAKAVWDFNRLQERSYEDMLDFAVRLYGVNPHDLTNAIALAQVGENQQLEVLLEEAAQELSTTSENMKVIINTLHSDALKEAGIEF